MEQIQWYTEGRRQPMLIGKDLSGRRIWGGPYVVWQMLGLIVAPLMWNTTSLWGRGMNPLVQVVMIGIATSAAVWLIGRYDFAGRNPIRHATAILTALQQTIIAPNGLNSTDLKPVRPTPAPKQRCTTKVTVLHRPNPKAPHQQPEPQQRQQVTLPAAPTTNAPNPESSTAKPPTPPKANTIDTTRMSPLQAFLAAAQPATTKPEVASAKDQQ